MRKQRTICLSLVASLLAVPTGLLAAPTLEVTSRTHNSFYEAVGSGFEPDNSSAQTDREWKFNRQDCLDHVKIKVQFSGTLEGSQKFYLFLDKECDQGTNCPDPDLTSSEAGSYVFDAADLSEDCSGEDSTRISLAVAEDLDNIDTEASWADAITVRWDMTAPPAPSGIEALGGNNKVSVSWTGADGEVVEDDTTTDTTESESSGSVSNYYVVYWKVGDATDTTVDSTQTTTEGTGSETFETSTQDTTPATTTDTASNTASNTTTDTTSNTASATTSDASTDSAQQIVFKATEIDCPAGGFAAGDDFDPANAGYSYKSSMSSGSAIGGLENGAVYKVAALAHDDYMNFSALSNVACAMPEKTSGFFDEFGTDGGAVNGKLCFVATVAFGSQEHPTVEALRVFRDRFLLEAPGGRAFVDAYYEVGPYVARGLAEHPAWLGFVRGLLSLLALLGSVLVAVGPFGAVTLLGLGMGGATVLTRLVRRRNP